MATLVLTAVGTAIGGPVGGAIGAGLGSVIDHATILKPGRREGPRLRELALQTSSYGTQIARLFGTMRVAGSVIWASPLIESRGTSRGGKGQASVTSYSYAASFAVLLSARPILSVGRIWADGTLIRGAAGDWKVRTGFRVHGGGEDQAVDPLIAGIEGVDGTPAYRGCAYVVFEQLALGEWGNRIPQLTFEVTADAGPVSVGAVAAELADEVDADVRSQLGGFAAAGGSVRAVLETLGDLSGAWFAPRGERVIMRGPDLGPDLGPDVDAANAVTIEDAGYANDPLRTAVGVRRIAAADRVPNVVTVAHYDPARDYQAGLQRAGTGSGSGSGGRGREQRIDAAAVLTAGGAKELAAATLIRSRAARHQRIVLPGPAAMAVGPGDVVALAGESGRARVTAASIEGLQVRLTLTPVATGGAARRVTSSATSGRVMGAADVPVGRTVLSVFETPVLDDSLATMPRLSIAATGEMPGWRGAALLYSLDDGASWTAAGGTAGAATIGVVTAAEPDAFSVALRADIDLIDADQAAIDAGANLALIGDELVGYGRAEPLGGGAWRLSALARGLRGTEAATGTGSAGARFVLLEAGTIRTIDLPIAAIGRTVRVMASGAGDDESPVEARCTLSGASLRPPAPIDLRVSEEVEGRRMLRWTRRSRLGWGWRGAGAPPLAEEREAYGVTLTLGDGSTLTVETDAPELALDPAAGAVAAQVVQHGTFLDSPPAAIALTAMPG